MRAVLIDIEGVLSTAGAALPGSISALARLRRSGLGVRFITNTTRQTRAAIARQLVSTGFDIAEGEIVTGAIAARRSVLERGLRPYLLIHPSLLPEFDGLPTDQPNAVVIGDAAEGFTYEAMNRAMRILLEQPAAPLIAIAKNRYFRAADGLYLDAGPYVAALEYATGVDAELSGKPAAAIFRAALDDLQSPPEGAVMIGDDLESDVCGAQAVGIRGMLVRTGKYRSADEADARSRADVVCDDFSAAVDELLGEAT